MFQSEIDAVWTSLDRSALAKLATQGPPPVFATISGAHLYGFASANSDVDLRGAFLTPAAEMLGLRPPPETLTIEDNTDFELDWVAHDLRKFARLMTNHNGYVLEQLYSPLVVLTTPLHEELKELGRGCITRPIHRHYRGFAQGRRKRLLEPGATVKHLLYAYRVYLTGIWVLRTGRLDSNVLSLNEEFALPQLQELIDRKRDGEEKMPLREDDLAVHGPHLDALQALLEDAHAQSTLPEEPTTAKALDAFVVRARLSAMP